MSKRKRRQLMPFSLSTSKWITSNLSFIFFLGLLGIIYIGNARYAEYKVRKIQTIQKEIQKLNWEYMSLKSELMRNSIESEVAKKIKHKGLRLLTESPKKIVVKKKDFE